MAPNVLQLVFSASALFAAGSVIAAPIIDQNATYQTNLADFYPAPKTLAQSFKQAAGNISGAGLFVDAASPQNSDVVTISLYDNLPNSAGNLLAFGSATATKGNWVDVYWTNLSITPETTYYLVFTSQNNVLDLGGSVDDRYSRGQAYAATGYQSFSNFDYAFRTYAEVGNVPAPTTLLLTGLGLAALAVFRSNSKQQG